MQGFNAMLSQEKMPENQPSGGFNAALGEDLAAAPSMDAAKGTPATEEEQDAYNRFVGMALMALSEKGFMEQAAKAIGDNPSKEDAMAKIGTTIVGRIYQASREQGAPVQPSVLLHGGAEIMQQIGEFATAAGHEVTPEQVETAFFLAADEMNDILAQQGALGEELAPEDEDEFMANNSGEAEKVAERIQMARQGIQQKMMGGA